MARPLRIEKAGGWYHITSRGNERKRIYRDDQDRKHFLDLQAEVVSRFGIRLHCCVLMDKREGLEESPWESVREQAVLGGEEFLRDLKKHIAGDKQEQRGARGLMAERPSFAAVVAAVEKVKGRSWAEFRDEYGDSGRDLALYLGRRLCGLKLTELAREADLGNYGVVATNTSRYELRLDQDQAEKRRIGEVLRLLNCEI